MPKVKPFRGVRPPVSLVEEVECRPYDVLSSEEARAEAGTNEKSLYHIIKPEINFPEGTSEYDPCVYERGTKNGNTCVRYVSFNVKGTLVCIFTFRNRSCNDGAYRSFLCIIKR